MHVSITSTPGKLVPGGGGDGGKKSGIFKVFEVPRAIQRRYWVENGFLRSFRVFLKIFKKISFFTPFFGPQMVTHSPVGVKKAL